MLIYVICLSLFFSCCLLFSPPIYEVSLQNMYHTVIETNTNASTESTISEFMKIERASVCAANQFYNYTIIQYFLGVNHFILVYYSSSFLSMLTTNASCSLSINIPITYYPADSYHRYYDTSPE